MKEVGGIHPWNMVSGEKDRVGILPLESMEIRLERDMLEGEVGPVLREDVGDIVGSGLPVGEIAELPVVVYVVVMSSGILSVWEIKGEAEGRLDDGGFSWRK